MRWCSASIPYLRRWLRELAKFRARRTARKIEAPPKTGMCTAGPNGAGHFVKMVHNGIEYGIMAAYAEGIGVLRDANIGKKQGEVDAETTPLRDPQHYQ